MLSIEKSPTFQAEYNTFQQRINSVKDEKVKEELNVILKSLINTVREMDHYHSNINPNNRLPFQVNEIRDTLRKIREMLSVKLEEAKNL